ncbi:MAG TPA: winged helix-turn-helix domain-containing protein [Terriglobales bacterium]|nr:winged helix-turn-helix domain-containing protein [Terriglobales bacterium]
MQSSQRSRGAIRFNAFELDLQAGELRKYGVRVKLQDQPFQVLQTLLERPGEAVTRDELQRRIWPSDTFVDFNVGINNAIKRLREALGDSADSPRLIETLPRRGYRFIGSIEASAPHIESLAVLPLENLSGDPEQEYFADGLTEALITNLAKISALRVVSRTTAMHYKGIHRPVTEIARELGVAVIVEGTVQRSGNQVRISVQLIQAMTDAHVWAENYQRDLRDVLALQAEVARAIAGEILAKLTPQEELRLTRARQVDPQAYECYLKGRFFWNKRTLQGFARAAEYFQQAIGKDASYAAAHAGLADTLSRLGWWDFVRPEEGCGRAKAAAQKAVELDASLAEAHAALGFAILHYDYSLLASEQHSRRATELDPQSATAAQALAVCLLALGRFEEAISEALRAVQLDPLSQANHWTAGVLMHQAGEQDRAIAESQKALELDPSSPAPHWLIGLALTKKKMYEDALEELEQAVQATRRMPFCLGALGWTYGVMGRTNDAQEVLNELQDISLRQYVSPYWSGMVYASLNDRDSAFSWLERARLEHAPWLSNFKASPWVDNLRPDPRFQDLLCRMNFPS